MLHVDEERLNAWLDFGRSGMTQAEYTQIGSHLARCAECAARLAEERALRERASSILGRGVPRAATRPSFEELAERAGRGRQPGDRHLPISDAGAATRGASRARRTRAAFVPYAWAASVMAALGLGWVASTMIDRDQVALEMVTPAPMESLAVGDPAVQQAMTESAVGQAAVMATGEPPPAAPEGGATAADSPLTPAPAPAAPTGAARQTPSGAAAAVAGADEPALKLEEAGPLSLDEVVAVGYSDQSRATQSGAVQSESARSATSAQGFNIADAGTTTVRTLAGRNAEADMPEGAIVQAAAGAAPPAAPAPPLPAADAPARIAALAQPGIVWTIVSREVAEDHVGTTLAIHPTLSLLRIEVPSNTASRVARSVYALPDGSQLTVTQVPAAEVSSTPLSGSERSATIRRADLLLTGSALVSADSIAELLEEMR